MADPQIRAIISQLERLAERAITKIALDISANAQERNRVDTGWSRANWIVSSRRPIIDTGLAEEIAPTTQDAAVAAREQRARAAALITEYRLSHGPAFVSNGVPYITILDALDGIIEPAIDKALSVDIRDLST